MTDPTFVPSAEVVRAKGASQAELHRQAAAVATERFHRKVFVRAVVEVSNFCRQNCVYCGMRRDNRALKRQRARWPELAELIIHHRPPSVTDVNIQSGEDPVAVREVVLPLIRALRRETNLGVSVCLGTLEARLYSELQTAGAVIYIMKFEIADPKLYARLHSPGTQIERLQHIRYLASQGWKVSSGFIAALPGQLPEDMVANLQLAGQLPLTGCSVSPFIPGDETPLVHAMMGDIDYTLNSMAALRLMRPQWMIPAVSALNLADPEAGYRRGLRTGANLVTINLTPPGLRGEYLLYKRDRFIMTEERILRELAAEGLEPSRQSLAEFCLTQSAAKPSSDRPAQTDEAESPAVAG